MISKLLDLKSLKIKTANLTQKQKQFAHLIYPGFFKGNKNPFRKGKTKKDYTYITPIELEEELFYLHPFLDPLVLEQGNVRRFPTGINEKYISEKYFEDKWVSIGNDLLAKMMERHIKNNLEFYSNKEKIKLIDIGPCGGAITTLFALRTLAKFNFLKKTEIAMIDIVPNVLEATLLGRYNIPRELIKEYSLDYAGENGEKYKELLKKGILIGVKEWYENPENKPNPLTSDALRLSQEILEKKKIIVKYFRGDGDKLPKGLKDYDFVLAGYLHHHMNYIGKKNVCDQMEKVASKNGFIGIIDFHVKDYHEYMKWYRPHFEKYGDAPPVECPIVGPEILKSFFKKVNMKIYPKRLEKSMLLYGVKN